jgi:hypothetical protein
MYEEEYIRATAVKVRSLVPSWRQSITTAEMPAAVERVYEEGRKNGRNEGYNNGYGTGYTKGYDQGNKAGYDKGYEAGAAAGGGVELPELTNPGTAEDLLAGKELIDGEGNIVVGNMTKFTNDAPLFASGTVTVKENQSPIGVIRIMTASGSSATSGYYEAGTQFSIMVSPSSFGNATPAAVVKGNTFTSQEGLKIEGTIEDGNEVAY